MATARRVVFPRDTNSSHALSIGLSVLATMIILLAFLGLVKWIYLKYRRIRMIHNIQDMLSPSTLDMAEGGLDTFSQSRRGRSGERGQGNIRDILIDIDPLGAPPRGSSRQDKCPSRASNGSRRSPVPSPTPGIIVGLLGSPAWETRMRREMDDHQWRQRRATMLDAPSWPSQQTFQMTTRSHTPSQSRPPSRESQVHPHPFSQSTTHGSHNSSQPQTLPRRRPCSAQFHTERRTVTRVTSFGELEVQEVGARIRRPQSLSAVMDQALMANRVQTQVLSRSQRGERDRSHSDARVHLDHSVKSRPSPIVEEVPSPAPSPAANRNVQLGVPLTSPNGTLQTRVNNTRAHAAFEREVGLGIHQPDHHTVIRASGTSSDVSMSVANSMSFGQLRHFPSPPESTVVSTIFIPPVNFDELEKSWRVSTDSDVICKSPDGNVFPRVV